ncbi:Outer dense fiber protein 4 [Manis javanica]|nr:Outer dense fiber protein 4 [Manis javanica]
MWNLGSEPGSDRQLPQKHCPKPLRGSVLPLWWKIIHRSRWKVQVLASELSLVAFILLLVMVFSKSWLCLSRSCFYQRWPADISSRIYTSSHIMSMGLLHYCNLKSHSHPENGKVIVIFFTLMLFPINLWIFKLKKNMSVPIGWSYFVGWLVFVLCVTCGLLCYFNQEHFWGLIISHLSLERVLQLCFSTGLSEGADCLKDLCRPRRRPGI